MQFFSICNDTNSTVTVKCVSCSIYTLLRKVQVSYCLDLETNAVAFCSYRVGDIPIYFGVIYSVLFFCAGILTPITTQELYLGT